jgi:excisionase family DNA binding protein
MKQSLYKNTNELPLFLTVMDVANLLGISKSSAYELANEQGFPKLKVVAGRTIVPRDRLMDWLNDNIVYDRL